MPAAVTDSIVRVPLTRCQLHQLRQIWRGMLRRCFNRNDKDYRYYGAKGVVVCDEWRLSFESFAAHVGARPYSDRTLDRFPNGDGNYEPGNVRWATRGEQQRNRNCNRKYTVGGRTLTTAEWAREVGFTHQAMQSRFDTMPADEAISRPRTAKTSRFIGVSWHLGKFRAFLSDRRSGKQRKIHLGSFESEEDAAMARDRAAIELFGPDTELNFPLATDAAVCTTRSNAGAASSDAGGSAEITSEKAGATASTSATSLPSQIAFPSVQVPTSDTATAISAQGSHGQPGGFLPHSPPSLSRSR